MIGFVIVSHSARLAEGVCELAAQAGQGRVALAAAGGTADGGIGTDAFRVRDAIEEVYGGDGVIVMMDLGSALLSAETALEMLDEDKRARVHLCGAPLVEGAIAAVSLAAAGAAIPEILAEAGRAGAGKVAVEAAAGEEMQVTLSNPLGLHARPAAQLVRLARSFQARITVENLTRQAGPADAGSLNSVLELGAREGHRLRVRAEGPEARQAVVGLAGFLEGALAGVPASTGIASGPLRRFLSAAAAVESRVVEDAEAECRRLMEAVDAAREDTHALRRWAAAKAGEKEAGIFDAQALFLDDLANAAAQAILERRINAESAWQATAADFAERLARLPDAYLAARAADVADVAMRVLRRLTGAVAATPVLKEPAILAAHDLMPSEVEGFDPALVLGVCLEAGSATAHSVILARALSIPVVVGLGPGLSGLPDGTTVALDGERGLVWVV